MAQQTRPEPMNASPYHSKVRVSLKFADTQFAAGSAVTGKVELECKAEKGLGIGVIMVELYAIEELTSRDHSATSTFLQSRRLFQGPGLPPSNSVHPYPSPGDPPLPANYYHARRGITTFLFQFPLPESSPSSIDFGSGLARLRYEVRASVGVAWKGEKKLVTDKKAVDVVERLEPDFNRIDPEGVIVGENGKIWMQGKVLGGFMVAGQPSCIELMVKNHSTKKNSGLSVTLTRELYLPSIPPTQKQPLQLSDTVTSVSFRGPEYIIVPGAEGVANLVIDVPKNARGVKGGRRVGDEGRVSECLFEVRCMVSVKLGMGIGSKDIRLDLPVIILHPSVAPDYPPYDMYAIPPEPPAVYDPSMMFYQPPVSPAPYLDRPMSPYAYPVPPMSPPIAPYVDHGQVWLPQPSMSPIPHNAYATTPYYGQMAAPPMTVAPFAIPPPRPSSAEPMPSQPLYNLPAGLPPVTIPPPLLPMPTGGNQPGVREEGKGERASRISHHLRMSSRHRSVSPPAHRYHVPEPAPAPLPPVTLVAIPPAQHASISPGSSPDTRRHPGTTLSLSPLHTGGEVVSPRPMLSPKRSFTNDPFDQVTQVENLERMAAQEDLGGPAIAPGPALSEHSADAREKTLPRPPVPTDKEPVPSSHARADMLFTPSAGGREDDAPPPRTPTLAAVTSLKVPRGLQLGNDSSGLDALEARLLAEVGTRKPEKDGNRPPDVRAVLPIAIPRPGGDIDPPNDSAISSLTLPGLDLDAELDAADEKTLRRGGNISVRAGSDRDVGEAADSTRARDSKETTGARTKGSKETVGRGREREREAKKGISAGMRRERDAKRSEGIDGKDKDRDKDKDKGKDKELHHLRKAAQGRIAAWLGSIDPDVPPPSGTPPPETPPPESLSPPLGSSPLRPTARSPLRSPAVSPARSPAVSPSRSVGRSPGRGPAISPDRSPARSPARSPRLSQAEIPIVASTASTAGQKSKDVGSSDQAAAAQEEAQAAPNPRSSGFVAIGTVRDAPTLRPPTNANGVKHGQKVAAPWDAFLLPKASPRLAVYPPRPSDPEVKYDVRSARGGRGGIVTSVASLWASAAQSPAKEPPKAVLPTTKPQPKPAKLAEQWKAKAGIDYPSSSTPKSEPSKSPALPDARPKALRPTPRTATSSPANIIPSSDPATTSVADLTTRRARMIKSASVPAVVSSSLATPMLSSTASLARPVPAAAERRKLNVKLPPTISETPDVHNQATATTTSASSQGGMKSPPAKAEMAFGQARLRELIKRYQGQVNS
ncbi:hypothetical protein PYCCODRAFT_1375122 [Trametes coccinea BRFM310]|uniref:Arrestin-like N-terminal domain-containing protein n=1 Tax=Trametes coccinea (strain BRFM310) TaxID=1353009 RepID=A0A1Y2IDM5_TRAC3|nr:hypothetical protein PYCCODRAFT_1375122 [Trametes coccinea BRFM310]